MDLAEKQLLDAAPDAMVVADAHGKIVMVNQQAEILFGYPRRELLGEQIEILLPDRYRARHPEHRSSYCDRPRVRPMGERLQLYGRRKDGAELPVEIHLSPITTKDGLFVVSAIRDATAHRRVEQSLTGILESSLNEIYIFDADSLHFIHVNRGARQNLGYSMEELKALTPLDLKPEFTAERFAQLLRPLLQAEQSKTAFKTVHRRKDGSTYPVEVHMQGTRYMSTPVISAIVLDITEREQAERALRESHQFLEQRVAERTVELQAAIKESNRANAGKSRFLAAASHDLRQPLQSLGLYLSVLTRQLQQAEPPAAEKFLEVSSKIRKSLDTMGGLLDALLDISKLDGGAIVPKKRDVRLQEILERIFTGNIQQAEEKGLELIRTEHDCVVHSDPGLLERIVENYVANAIRYTESGRVSIECRPVGNGVKIVVSDTGVGIAAGELEKVFDEYYQLDNPVRDLRKGLGLGLSIVRLIAKLLDHPIDVSSTPGKGSSFFVEVPLGEETSERAAAPAQVQTAPSDRREPIVLFVDDDPAIVDATTMLLKLSGFQVHSALSGNEALAHVANGIRPDVIVTDYRLPGLSGIEVVRQVRERMGETTPTVLMTGDTSSKEIALAGLPECTVLHKPVDTDQLVSLMEFLTA